MPEDLTAMQPAKGAGYLARFNAVVDYIDNHLAETLDLRTLAAVAHFSPWHFHRLFQAMMGETLAERVRRRRLEVAAGLLLSSPPVPVQAIALDCGFGAAEVFTRAFKSHFGVTPSGWRSGAHESWVSARRVQLRKIHRTFRSRHRADECRADDEGLVRPIGSCSTGQVRFYVLSQAEFGCRREASKVAPWFQTAKATRSNLRARMTRAWVGAKPRALIDSYNGLSALLWLAANATRYI